MGLQQALYYCSLVGAAVLTLAGLILVRVTTPRFKLEALSRLAWKLALLLLLLVFVAYALGWALG